MRTGAALAASWDGSLSMAERRARDIEKLLHWAFRDELPKKRFAENGPGFISPMFRLADLGTRVDESPGEPGFPAALGEPHDDAVTIGAAVEALDDVAVDWPSSRPLIMGPHAGLLADDDPALARLVIGTVGLVALHARMGTRPRWDTPQLGPLIRRNGKPTVQYVDAAGQVVEGTPGRHYGLSARCPLQWYPAPRQVAYDRMEYWVWLEALDLLSERLTDALTDYRPLKHGLPRTPWRE